MLNSSFCIVNKGFSSCAPQLAIVNGRNIDELKSKLEAKSAQLQETDARAE